MTPPPSTGDTFPANAPDRTATQVALKISLGYATFAALWIVFSDRALGWMVQDVDSMVAISLIKGGVFVLITSLWLFTISRRWWQTSTDALLREQQKIAREAARTQAMLDMSANADTADEQDFMRHGLEVAEQLTSSQIAFVHFVHDDQETIELVTWSNTTLAHYCKAAYDSHYPISKAGIWADALRHKAPVIINDYANTAKKQGLPEGHAELKRLISVPVIQGGLVRMVAGVGNKTEPYTESDVETLRLISEAVWRIVRQRRADAALRVSEAHYKTMFDSNPLPMWVHDANNLAFLAVNDAAVSHFGYSRHDFLHKTLHELLTETPLATPQKPDIQTQANHKATPTRMTCQDGRQRLVEIAAHPIRYAGQQAQLALALDTTDREAALTQLRKLSQAVAQSPESIVITNMDAQIEYVNQAFVQSTGYQAHEVMGQNPRVLHSGKTPEHTYQDLWTAMKNGQMWKGEFHNRRKDGSEYIEFAIITPLRQSDGQITHYVAVKEDITEKKRIGIELDGHRHHLEDLVTQRTAELNQARRDAEAANLAKSAFLANMSHEIRTPMNAIMGLSHLLKNESVSPAQLDKLHKIDNACHHLLSIINDVLDISKIEAGKVMLSSSAFEVADVVNQVVALVEPLAAAKSLVLQVQGDALTHWVKADATRLRQALLNLVGNAVKFTDFGSITIQVDQIDASEGLANLKFSVIDTGIGVAPDVASRLFHNFEQGDTSTTRKHGGTGLGLAITRSLAQLMGGDAGVNSSEGVGSVFWFTARLVLHQSGLNRLTDAPTDAKQALQTLHPGAHVLLADDNDLNLEVANELLTSAGLSVTTARNGQQVLDLLALQPKNFELVLMDLQMPELDGLQATRLLRASPEGGQLPVVALSANAFEPDRWAARDAGMNDFIAKPIDPNVLYATVLQWLPQPKTMPKQVPQALATSAPSLVPLMPDHELQRVLSELSGLLALSDTAALTLFQQHAPALELALGEPFKRLGQQLQQFAFDQAQETLKPLLKQAK